MTFSILTAAVLVSGLLIGLLPVVVDGLRQQFRTRLNLADGRAEWAGALYYVAWLPAMPFAGYLLDHLPQREILFYGLIAVILGLAWLALVRSYPSLLLALAFLGVGYSVATIAVIHVMPVAFFPDHVEHYKLNLASLNLGFVPIGLGALIGPWITIAIERWWGYRQGILYLSIGVIAPAALAALCDRTQFPPTLESTASWHDAFTLPPMFLIVFVLLVYFAIENCLEFWPDAYLQEIGYRDGSRTSLLVFWLAFIGTRGAAAWFLYEYGHHRHLDIGFTIVLVLATALILGNLSGGFEMGSGTLWFWILGACYGPILPCLLGLAIEIDSSPLPTSLLGALVALSGLDTVAVRPVMTWLGANRPARAVMWGPTVLAVLLGATLLLLAFLRK
jgi:MFS family permease